MSVVWKYFKVKQTDSSKVVCLLCFPYGEIVTDKIVKYLSRGAKSKSYSTKPMWNHLRCMHPEEHELAMSQSGHNMMKSIKAPSYYLANLVLPSASSSHKWEDRKYDFGSLAAANFPPGLNENSTGSVEGQGGCDDVPVALSPEQFLSEDMDHGASPPTPSSQRPESYKLRHNNHLTLVLESLAEDESFMDVTLTAQGKAIKAHKSVLSAVSPYFRGVLKENPCQHPIIIMPRDIRFEELNNIISYVYKGEMTVAADDLSSLLKTAEILQVTGLSPSDSNGGTSGIMSQMQGLPSGVFNNTSPSKGSKKSKHSRHQTQHNEETQNYNNDTQGRIDPLEFLNADMTCVKEEITSDNDENEDTTTVTLPFALPMDVASDSAQPLSNPASSTTTVVDSTDTPNHPNRRKSITSSSPRSLDDPSNKPFNPGEPARGSPPSSESPSDSSSSTSPGPYVCPHCLETHRPNDLLHSHLRLKHPSKPSFVCNCGRVYVRQMLLVEHQKKCKF